MSGELTGRPMSKRSLRSIRDRWQRDADVLNAAYPHAQAQMRYFGDAEHETIRNLETAIASIEGLITREKEPEQPLAALSAQEDKL